METILKVLQVLYRLDSRNDFSMTLQDALALICPLLQHQFFAVVESAVVESATLRVIGSAPPLPARIWQQIQSSLPHILPTAIATQVSLSAHIKLLLFQPHQEVTAPELPSSQAIAALYHPQSFTSADQEWFQLLLPHIFQAYDNYSRYNYFCQQSIVRAASSHEHSILHHHRQLGLTHRQAEVLQYVMQGKENQEIATQLNCREATVRKHLENIYRALHVTNRTAAISYVLSQLGIVTVQSPQS